MAIFLFRGLPGAGKSTAAAQLCDVVFAADDFFLAPSGSYEFDPQCIGEAHRQCIENVESALRLGIESIGVANTFTQEWELEAYFTLGRQYGVKVFSLVVENRHGGASTHGVPEEIIARMGERFSVRLK